MSSKNKQSWENASWLGSRRAMIRQSLKLTVRERIQALEELCKTSQKLSTIKTSKKVHSSFAANQSPNKKPKTNNQ